MFSQWHHQELRYLHEGENEVPGVDTQATSMVACSACTCASCNLRAIRCYGQEEENVCSGQLRGKMSYNAEWKSHGNLWGEAGLGREGGKKALTPGLQESFPWAWPKHTTQNQVPDMLVPESHKPSTEYAEEQSKMGRTGGAQKEINTDGLPSELCQKAYAFIRNAVRKRSLLFKTTFLGSFEGLSSMASTFRGVNSFPLVLVPRTRSKRPSFWLQNKQK